MCSLFWLWRCVEICQNLPNLYTFKVFKKILFIFREGKGGRKGGRETSVCGCLSCTPHWGPPCNPGTCCDWELNQQPFGSQAGAQSTEPHQPGPNLYTLSMYSLLHVSYSSMKLLKFFKGSGLAKNHPS